MSAAFRSRFSLSKPKDKPAPTAAAAAGKAVVAAASPDPKESTKGLRGTRRRLSVVSDNKLIEGIATLGVHDETKTEEHRPEHVIKMYAGVSKKVRVRAVGGGGAPSRGVTTRSFQRKRRQASVSFYRAVHRASCASASSAMLLPPVNNKHMIV